MYVTYTLYNKYIIISLLHTTVPLPNNIVAYNTNTNIYGGPSGDQPASVLRVRGEAECAAHLRDYAPFLDGSVCDSPPNSNRSNGMSGVEKSENMF